MAGNAHRNVSVDITGDSDDLSAAYDKASRRSKEFDKETEGSSGRITDLFKKMGSTMESSSELASQGFNKMGLIGKAVTAGLAAGIFLLGPASVLTAGLITLAFGAAFAGIGILAASESMAVKSAFTDLWTDIKSGAVDAAKPLEATLLRIPDVARAVGAEAIGPIREAFDKMAPAIDKFVVDMGSGLKSLIPALGPLTDGFNALLGSIGDRAPDIFGTLGDAIITLADTAKEHSDDFASLLVGFMNLVNGMANVMDFFADHGTQTMDGINKSASVMTNFFRGITYEMGIVTPATKQYEKDVVNAHININRTVQSATDAAYRAVLGYTGLGETMDEATVSASTLSAELNELTGVHVTADMAIIKYEASLDKANDTVMSQGSTLDVSSEAGRKNYLALLDLVQASHKLMTTKADEGATVKELNATYSDHRIRLLEIAEKMVGNRKEAEILIDRYHKIPKSINTKITADTGEAQGNVDRFITLNSGRQIPIHIINKQGLPAKDGGLIGYARGGQIKGPGGSRSDSVPIAASRGEFMVNASATKRNLPALQAMNAGKPVGGSNGGGSTTNIYQIALPVGANIAAAGSEIVKMIQAHEQVSGPGWRD